MGFRRKFFPVAFWLLHTISAENCAQRTAKQNGARWRATGIHARVALRLGERWKCVKHMLAVGGSRHVFIKLRGAVTVC